MPQHPMNLVDSPIAAMSYIVPRHIRSLSDKLRPYGLTTPMWRIMNALTERDGRNIGELAEHAAFERSYVSRVIDRMEDAGLVVRRGDTTDKRFAAIHLTNSGRKLFKDARPVVLESHEKATQGLSDQEYTQLCDLLRRVQENVYRRG